MATVTGMTAEEIESLFQNLITSITVDASGNIMATRVSGEVFNAGQVQVTPPLVGKISMWPTTTAPAGYLLCNGGTFLSTDHPELATLLGDTFGTHSGTTYYLPDYRGRSPLGAGLAVPAVTGGTAHTLGQKGGHDFHKLTVAELAKHSHTGTTGDDSPDHAHSMPGHVFTWGQGGLPSPVYVQNAIAASGYPPSNNLTTSQGAWSSTYGASARHRHSIPLDGSDTAHNNLHPYLGINFIIKT